MKKHCVNSDWEYWPKGQESLAQRIDLPHARAPAPMSNHILQYQHTPA